MFNQKPMNFNSTFSSLKAPESDWKVRPYLQAGNSSGRMEHNGGLGVERRINDSWSVGGNVGHGTGSGMHYGVGVKFRF